MSKIVELIEGPQQRQALVIELAGRPAGVSVEEAFERGKASGDKVTREAYHNVARRLAQRGILVEDATQTPKRYRAAAGESYWIDESHIESMVNPDYPLVALALLQESYRQAAAVPEQTYVEIRSLLRQSDARQSATGAVLYYIERIRDLCDAMRLAKATPSTGEPVATLQRRLEEEYFLLKQLAKYGLGLSKQALDLPAAAASCVERQRQQRDAVPVDMQRLEAEIASRFPAEMLVVECFAPDAEKDLIVVGVDGSTRGGVVHDAGQASDFALGGGPMVNVNTAVAFTRNVRLVKDGREKMVFMRLPEKPEDLQREDNRFTVMAKLFYPDLTDQSYMHSVWNAMDLLETRVALRSMTPWRVAGTSQSVPACDAVLRDGTVVPQARDSVHYVQNGTYGDIVREMIGQNWDLCRTIADGHSQTAIGVVKESQLRVLTPIVNWVILKAVGSAKLPSVATWPIEQMNRLDDQALVTRILTARQPAKSTWLRSAIYLRPFFAASDLGELVTGLGAPSEAFVRRQVLEQRKIDDGYEDDVPDFWKSFLRERDPYVKLLDNATYANTYISFAGRLDSQQSLPRIEFIVPCPHEVFQSGFPDSTVQTHLVRTLQVLRQDKFGVAQEHTMYGDPHRLDILPASLVQAHEIVKIWAEDLMARAREYLGAAFVRVGRRARNAKLDVRKMKRSELLELGVDLVAEREMIADRHEPSDPR